MNPKTISLYVRELYKSNKLSQQAGPIYLFLSENQTQIGQRNLANCLSYLHRAGTLEYLKFDEFSDTLRLLTQSPDTTMHDFCNLSHLSSCFPTDFRTEFTSAL